MDFKKLFIGGLCASAVLAGCTKELSAPSVEGSKEAVSLGEGFTIVGTKGDFGVETKAEFNSSLNPLWGVDDKVGAAWYDIATYDETTKEWASTPTGKFMSNTWFARTDESKKDGAVASAEFYTSANLMAGAYVLYHPYDPEWTEIKNFIPVKVSTKQTMNIAAGHEADHLGKEIFAYKTFAAVPGGEQLTKFKLSHLTNVLELHL